MAMRVPGHTLVGEGKPFDQPPCCYLAGRYRMGTSGDGHGKCSCGATSEHLLSGAERKQWHREHKQAVKEGSL